MRTYWRCDRCGRAHFVIHEAHADVYTVVSKIATSHNRYKNPCKYDAAKVRVGKSKIPTQSDANGVKAETESPR